MRRSGLLDAPEPCFSAIQYLAANRDVAAAGIDPLLHYLLNGWAEGRPLRPGLHEPPHLKPTAVLGWREVAWRGLRRVVPRTRELHPEPGPDPAPTIRIRPARGAMPTGWCLLSARGPGATLLVISGGTTGSVEVPAHPAKVLVRMPDVPARLALRRPDPASPRPVITVREIDARRARQLGGGRLPDDATTYEAWVRRYDTPNRAQREAMAARAAALDPRPKFRVLAAPGSLLSQIYVDWSVEGSADFVVTVAPGAELAPHALLMFAEAIAADPRIDVLYADEDRLVAGIRQDPWFKPDFCPERGTHLFGAVMVSRETLSLSRPSAGEGEGLANLKIVHLPYILAHAGSRPDRLRDESLATPAVWPTVTAIVPTRDQAALLSACLDGLLDHTDYPSLDIIVADNDSIEPETRTLLETARQRGVTILPCSGPFNFSAINNRAVAAATGELLLFLNNDISMPHPGWLREMVRPTENPDVGAVGAKLLYPDNTLQHGGVVVGMGGVAGHVHLGAEQDDPGYFGRLRVTQEVSAVTAACMLVPRPPFRGRRRLRCGTSRGRLQRRRPVPAPARRRPAHPCGRRTRCCIIGVEIARQRFLAGPAGDIHRRDRPHANPMDARTDERPVLQPKPVAGFHGRRMGLPASRPAPLGASGRRCFRPGIVAAERPQMPLGIAAGVVAAAIGLVDDIDHDLGPCRLGAGVMRVDFGRHDIDRAALAADFVRLAHQPAELGFLHRAQHDHAAPERELRMVDRAALAWHDQVTLEPESAAQKFDRRRRVAIHHRRNHRHLLPPASIAGKSPSPV